MVVTRRQTADVANVIGGFSENFFVKTPNVNSKSLLASVPKEEASALLLAWTELINNRVCYFCLMQGSNY
jgi:hypothetical protein